MSLEGTPSNNGMQLTKAARCAPFAFRSWGQSLRAAFAADPGCWTDRGTDRRAFVPPPSAVAEAPSVLPLGNGSAWATLVRSLHQSRPSLGARPNIFQLPVGPVSTQSFPSASLWLGISGQTTDSGFPVVAPRQGAVRPSNKGLKWTRSAPLPPRGPRHLTRC